jgi:repressor lexA|nr:MAG TPA: Repressor protein CI [Caudoviricetes sp.]
MTKRNDLGNKDIFSKNLKMYMEDKDISRTQLAEILDTPYSTLSDWVNGKKYPRIDKIELLANYFGIDKSDLIEENINIEDIPGAIPIQKGKLIPILGEIACGDPILAQENLDGYFLSDPSIIKGDFILRAQGDSMIDAGIAEGDYVFIKQTPDVENGAIAAVLIDDDTTLKRFYKSDDKIVLQPENKAYSPIIITAEDGKNIKILGQVIGLYKQDIR